MPISQTTKNYLSEARNKGPNYYKRLSDEDLYYILDKRGVQIPKGAVWEDEAYTSPSITTQSDSQDLGFFANIADWGIDENSYEFMKAAYNHSITGTVEKLATGESRYNVDETDFTILQDIGATLFSFLMPLDLLTMGAGGFIGGKVANSALKSGIIKGASQRAATKAVMETSKKGISKRVGKEISEELVEKGLGRQVRKEAVETGIKRAQTAYLPYADSQVMNVLNKTNRALLGGFQQAPVLGLYEAVIGGLNSEIEGKNFLEGASWGAFHGGTLGFLTGAIGGGMGAVQAGMFKTAKGKEIADLGLKNWLIARGVVGLPGQVIAESSVFSGFELAERVIGGEDLQGKEILHTFARNVGLFGALKTQGILTRQTMKKWNETKAKLKEGYENWAIKKKKEMIENAEDNLSEDGVDSSELKQEAYKATTEEIKNQEKFTDIDRKFNEIKDEMFEADGSLKDIADPDAKYVYNTNNYLIEKIEEIKKLKKSTVNDELKSQADEVIVEMESVKKLIEDKFNDRSWMKESVPEVDKIIVGGQTKEEALKRWGDDAIKGYAEDLNIRIIDETPGGKIRNKEEVIDAIYKQQEVLDIQQKELSRLGGEEAAAKALIAAGVVEKPTHEKIETEVAEKEFFTNPDKLDKETKKHVKPIKESNLSDGDKNTLAYSSIKTGRDISPSATKEASKLMEFSKEKNGVDINKLTPSELEFLVSKYINDRLGFEMLSKKTNIRISKEKLSEHFKGNQEKVLESMLIYNRILNNLKEHFRHGEMKNILGYDIMAPKGKSISVFQPEGRKEIGIPGGKEGLNKLSQSAKNKKKGFDVGDKNISGEESSLMIDLLSEGKARPGDAHHIRIKDINLENGTITLRKKTKRPNINVSEETLNKIKDHIKKNNLKENDKLFKVENTTETNILMDRIFENAQKNIQPYIIDTATGKEYPFIDRKATLPEVKIGKETGGGGKVREGIQGSSLFRRRMGEENLEVWGHKRPSTGKQYGKRGEDRPIKEEVSVEEKLSPIKDTAIKKGDSPEVQGRKLVWELYNKDLEKGQGASVVESRYDERGHILLRQVGKEISDVYFKELKKIRNFEVEKFEGKEVMPSKRKTQMDVGEVKKNIEIEREKQESLKEILLKKRGYRDLKIELGQKLKPKDGETVLGQIEGHVIKIAEGKVKIDTIPHEVSHYVVDVLKAFGTAVDKALIKRGINMFGKHIKRKDYKSESDFLEAKEEAFVQAIGEYAAGQLTNRTLIGKAKSWVKAFNARLKDMFGIATKEDVAYIMSRRVVKGNIPTGRQVSNYINRMKTHYQKDTPTKKSNNGVAHKIEKELIKAGVLTRKEADEIRIENSLSEEGKGNLADWTDGAVQGWLDALEVKEKTLSNSKSNKKTYLDELTVEYNIEPGDASGIAVTFGRIDGNYNKLTKSNKKKFEDHIRIVGHREKRIETTLVQSASIMDTKLPAIMGMSRTFLPAYYFLQKYGGPAGEKIAQSILRFDVVANNLYKGKGDLAVMLIKKHLPSKKRKLVWMFDTDRVDKMIKDASEGKEGIRKLTSEEMDFYKNTKDKNGEEITWETKESDIATKEGVAKKIHADLMQHYWDSLYKEVKGVTNKVEFAQFEKEFNKKFIDGYFGRRLTKKALEHFVSAKNGKKLQGYIDESIKEAAESKAKEEGKKGKEFNDRVKELIKDKDHMNSVAKDILNMITHKHHKVKNKHLLKRGPLIDEFIEIEVNGKKKLIRTYETEMESTIEPYIMTMSKYLGTVRIFPEYTGLGGKYKLAKSSLAQIETIIQNKTMGSYALKAVHKLIGFKGEDPLLSEMHSMLAAISHTSAAAGLSSPTSGLKNLMIGIPRATASFGFINTGIGMIKLFDKSVWNEAREKGILEYGAKHLELAQAKLGWLSMEKLFKVNLMTYTENVNRIVSHEAGKLYFSNQLSILHGKRGLFGEMGERNAKRLMRDMWKLSDNDIKFLKSKEVRDMDFKSKESEGKYEYLIRQVGHYSHVSAQGGTSVGLLPLWASGSIGRPFTLFQRMAYATTFDSYINYVKPIFTHKNVMPMARALAMHTLSGAALYGFYKALLGKEPPVSAGNDLDKAWMYLHRSEFLGLFGFLNNPYDEGMFQSLAQPVIARNAKEGVKQLYSWYSGGQAFFGSGGALQNFAKKTTVAYNQWDQLVYKNTPEYRLMKKVSVWRNQFSDEYPSFKKAGIDVYSERTFYYRDLKNSLHFGSDKEIANDYFAAYNFIVTELEEISSSPQWRHKQAIKAIKHSLLSMNPVKISDASTGTNISKKGMFLNWIEKHFGKEGLGEVLKSEKNYKYKMRHLEKLLKKKSLWKEKSVYAFLNL